MLNIFNLFLLLFALWGFLMVSSGNISWLYLLLGTLFSAITAIFSYKLKLIEKKSELIYLSFGFYRNFIKTYLTNFFSSFKLVFDLAFRKEPFKMVTKIIDLEQNSQINLGLFCAIVNMTAGLCVINLEDRKIFIQAIEKDYFTKFDSKKLICDLSEINDDNLI